MKILRRVCVALVAVGAFLLFPRHDSEFDTLPFPAVGLTVKMKATISVEGDYYLRVSMPTADHEIALTEETVPCSLGIQIIRAGQSPIPREVTSLSRYSEYGYAGVQYYKGNNWHFWPGEYEIEILSRADCPAAVSRGAMLTLEQQVTHGTERFLARQIAYYGGVFSLCAGLLGLIVFEFTMRKAA